MTKSDFKKQIKEIFRRELVIGYKSRPLPTDTLERYIAENIKPFMDVIEEAKKEFEVLINGTWSVDEEGFHPHTHAKDSWLNPREAIKWFRKWFGDEK